MGCEQLGRAAAPRRGDVAAGGGRGSGVIAGDLGAALSPALSSRSGAAVAKDFCNSRLTYDFDGR